MVGAAPRLVVARLVVARILGPHGVRGLVRLRSYTEEPAALASYGPLTDSAGRRRLEIRLKGRHKGDLLAEIEGVTSRAAAETLAGMELCLPRDRLPEHPTAVPGAPGDRTDPAAAEEDRDGDGDGDTEAEAEAEADLYFQADLIGLDARDESGAPLGCVTAIHDFGAGDIIEIHLESGGELLLPFTAAFVPEVAPGAGGHVTVAPPPGWLELQG